MKDERERDQQERRITEYMVSSLDLDERQRLDYELSFGGAM